MFVWNAISSIVLMIFEISEDEATIAYIAVRISFTSAVPVSAAWRA